MHYCDDCSKEYPEKYLIPTYYDNYVCINCFLKNDYRICDRCEKAYKKGFDELPVENYCWTCADDLAYPCSLCGVSHIRDNLLVDGSGVNELFVCINCLNEYFYREEYEKKKLILTILGDEVALEELEEDVYE